MTDFTLPSYVISALSRLEDHGFQCYVVGGSVRDMLLGREINDYDICTDATPDQIRSVFADFRTIPTGIIHGTVTVLIKEHPLEITTFRTEGAYSDGRHPDRVDFTSDIVTDLSRRDFSINAIAYHPKKGLIDPFEGCTDLRSGRIRCVGNPALRFEEDALRILRAIRFASVLDFSIEADTLAAAYEKRARLDRISRERVREELCKLLCGKACKRVLLENVGIITQIIPELHPTVNFDQKNPHHDFSLYEHLVRTVSALPQEPILRLSGLLHDIEKPSVVSEDERGIRHYYSHAQKSAATAVQIMKRLRFSNAEVEHAQRLIHYHDGIIEETEGAVKRRLRQFSLIGFEELLSLQLADRISQKKNTAYDTHTAERDRLLAIAHKILSEHACFDLSSLAVDGNDLLSLGYRGKEIGKALSLLLDAVINGECENERRALLSFLNPTIQDK